MPKSEEELERELQRPLVESYEAKRKEMAKLGTDERTHPYTANPGPVTAQPSVHLSQYYYRKYEPTREQMDHWERERDAYEREACGNVFDPAGARAQLQEINELKARIAALECPVTEEQE